MNGPLYKIHVLHVERVVKLAFPEEWRTYPNLLGALVNEFWNDTDEQLAASDEALTFPPWVEAVRQLELQRRTMMTRAPEIGTIAEAHVALRHAVDHITAALNAVESQSYGQMMELVVDQDETL